MHTWTLRSTAQTFPTSTCTADSGNGGHGGEHLPQEASKARKKCEGHLTLLKESIHTVSNNDEDRGLIPAFWRKPQLISDPPSPISPHTPPSVVNFLDLVSLSSAEVLRSIFLQG